MFKDGEEDLIEVGKSPLGSHLADELLRDIDEALLPLTIDQLRTYVSLCRTLTVKGAASLLNRQQTSVIKQLHSIENHVGAITGEVPLIESGVRGGEMHVTRTGEAFRHHAERIIEDIFQASRTLEKKRQNYPVKVGLADFVIKLPRIREILNETRKALQEKNPQSRLELSRVQFSEIKDALTRQAIDFAFAQSIMPENEGGSPIPGVSFTEFFRYPIVVLSNRELKAEGSSVETLRSLGGTIVSPNHGIFYNLLVKLLSKNEVDGLIAFTAGIHFGIDLIRFSSEPLCMLVPQFVCDNIVTQVPSEANRLWQLPLNDLGYRARIGLFRRQGEENSYYKNHPLRIFEDVVASHRGDG